MINYDNFVLMINEGLIKTHLLDKCKNIIDKEAGNLNHWYNIDFNLSNNTFSIEYDTILSKDELEYMFHTYSILGFYLSYYKIIRSKMSKTIPWIDIKNYEMTIKKTDKIVLFFESRFDKKLVYIPKKLYHVTNIENIYGINKKGIYPLYFEKGDWRPDRIYFSLLKKDADNILNKNIFEDKMKNKDNKYIIYEIDTTEIHDLVLYEDPRSNGVYSYNHINPKLLKII